MYYIVYLFDNILISFNYISVVRENIEFNIFEFFVICLINCIYVLYFI